VSIVFAIYQTSYILHPICISHSKLRMSFDGTVSYLQKDHFKHVTVTRLIRLINSSAFFHNCLTKHAMLDPPRKMQYGQKIRSDDEIKIK
jgi:hypothetical protein